MLINLSSLEKLLEVIDDMAAKKKRATKRKTTKKKTKRR